jgi:uncharacterized protein (DUF488 family)
MGHINLYTIGFTQKNAETFFTLLKNSGIKNIIDIRLNNVSQLAGFTKRDDLKYFLHELCDCEYRHEPSLAPTKEILDGYKNKKIGWNQYKIKFNKLLKNRKAELILTPEEIDNACLLCSEPTSENCHRRLVAEFMKEHINDIKITHL